MTEILRISRSQEFWARSLTTAQTCHGMETIFRMAPNNAIEWVSIATWCIDWWCKIWTSEFLLLARPHYVLHTCESWYIFPHLPLRPSHNLSEQRDPTCSVPPYLSARPNQLFMFLYWSIDFRKVFYWSFSKYEKSCSMDLMFQDPILRTGLCGTGFISQHCWAVDFRLISMISRKCFVPVRYQLPKIYERVWPFFASVIGSGGSSNRFDQKCRLLIKKSWTILI